MYSILNGIQRIFNRSNERRVLRMLRGPRMPSWVKSAEWAPSQLYKMGVDVVVQTDKNMIFLQIKQNYGWAHALSRLSKFPLAVIVCNDTTMDDHLYMRLMEGLEYGYNRT